MATIPDNEPAKERTAKTTFWFVVLMTIGLIAHGTNQTFYHYELVRRNNELAQQVKDLRKELRELSSDVNRDMQTSKHLLMDIHGRLMALPLPSATPDSRGRSEP